MMPPTAMMMNNSTCTATQHTRGATRRFRQGSRASRHTPGHDEHDGVDDDDAEGEDDDDDDALLSWYQLQFFFILGVK